MEASKAMPCLCLQVTHNVFSKAVVKVSTVYSQTLFTMDLSKKDMPTTVGLSTTQARNSNNQYSLSWTVSLTPGATVEEVKQQIYTNVTAWKSALDSWPLQEGKLTIAPGADSVDGLFADGPNLHLHTPRAADISATPSFYRSLYALQVSWDLFSKAAGCMI